MERERGGTVAAAVSASAASAGGASADDMITMLLLFCFLIDRSNARQILFDELFHVGIVSSLVCW